MRTKDPSLLAMWNSSACACCWCVSGSTSCSSSSAYVCCSCVSGSTSCTRRHVAMLSGNNVYRDAKGILRPEQGNTDYSMYATFLTDLPGSVLFTRSNLLKRKDLSFSCLRLGLIRHRRSLRSSHLFLKWTVTILIFLESLEYFIDLFCRLHHVFNVSNRLVRIGPLYQI